MTADLQTTQPSLKRGMGKWFNIYLLYLYPSLQISIPRCPVEIINDKAGAQKFIFRPQILSNLEFDFLTVLEHWAHTCNYR